MGKGPEQTFIQGGHTYSGPRGIAIREMQIKTTMRHHLIRVRMAIINKSTNKCWQGCGERET